MRPSKEFTIKILSSEDYDNLPYDGAHDSIGMSVMATKTAYIRSTGVKDLDQNTINHEFDELMQKTSPHEIDGIRYKKTSQVFIRIAKSIAAAITGGPVGSLVNDVFGTIEGVQQEKAQTKAKKQSRDFQRQQNELFSSFQPSGATKAFAPQAQAPLGQSDFNTSLSNLDKNAAATKKSVFSNFRGLGAPAGNTAFSGSLASADASSKLAKQNFLEDQRKLGSTFA